MHKYDLPLIEKLNRDIAAHFPHLFLIDASMKKAFDGVSRLVMLDRYTQKDINHITLGEGDLVVCVVKDDPKFPTRGIGYVTSIDGEKVHIRLRRRIRRHRRRLVARRRNRPDRRTPSTSRWKSIYEQIAHRVAEQPRQSAKPSTRSRISITKSPR
ncbi:MAG: hypothetical protein MZU97_15790 [Bacillus subtilis]|nr:hypothetical protein [Bacillus subtilis]